MNKIYYHRLRDQVVNYWYALFGEKTPAADSGIALTLLIIIVINFLVSPFLIFHCLVVSVIRERREARKLAAMEKATSLNYSGEA